MRNCVKTLFDLREPESGRADGSSTADIPEVVRRELLECARHNGRISYYYLCAIYRKGYDDARVAHGKWYSAGTTPSNMTIEAASSQKS